MGKGSEVNNRLNSLDQYVDKSCIYCGAKGNLNIEGHIHHTESYRCLDTKACNRRKRKLYGKK